MFLVFSHGISLSLRQLKRILKAKGLGQIRNARLFKLWKNTSEEAVVTSSTTTGLLLAKKTFGSY